MPVDLMHDHARAVAAFKKSEATLAAALDKLDAARTAGDHEGVASAYKNAQRLELECSKAGEAAELARRAVWQQRARQAEADLEAAALPLLAAIDYCTRAAGGLVLHPTRLAVDRILSRDRPPYAGPATPPPLPEDSAALERAEDSNIYLIRGNLVSR